VIAHEEGKAVLVYYALPDELVEAVPRGRQGGLQTARTERVLEASPDRIEARCPHFGECGGCHWQHSRYQRQLALKRQVVEDVWRRAGVRLPNDTPVLGMDDPWRYRIRGEFEASYRPGQPMELGFHRHRSHSVMPVRTCPIHDERIERAMLAFRQAAVELDVRDLKTLLLTVEPTGRGLLWRARRQGRRGREAEEALGQRVAELLPDLVLLDDSMSLEFWDLAFRVRSDSFVQTNYRQMLVLYQLALDMLAAGGGDSVLDLYSGIGTLGIPLARSAGRVTAIEENPIAVQLSRLNSRINRTPNFRMLPGKVETALREVRMGDHQAAVLDPPRAGCDPAALAELLRLAPQRMVYVSCEPSTHARDIAMLVRGGYRLRRAAIVDMFPHTYHVETVALLERSAA
jgi:23S rRNA (uracil1939-C5)-methyltransferase